VSFNQAYDVFKNGNYSKLIKLTLLSILFYFVISLVIGFIVNILVTIIILPIAPLGMLIENPDSAMQGVSIVMMIFLVILAIIISILAYIPYIILFITYHWSSWFTLMSQEYQLWISLKSLGILPLNLEQAWLNSSFLTFCITLALLF